MKCLWIVLHCVVSCFMYLWIALNCSLFSPILTVLAPLRDYIDDSPSASGSFLYRCDMLIWWVNIMTLSYTILVLLSGYRYTTTTTQHYSQQPHITHQTTTSVSTLNYNNTCSSQTTHHAYSDSMHMSTTWRINQRANEEAQEDDMYELWAWLLDSGCYFCVSFFVCDERIDKQM